ncbi:serine/threonine-protein kinase Kist-like [Panulirus ornatus]|uniref:serine/threonine-protein kinase Kist-like n=1 Tax=Panulirus ornatus TaxID=150431 RepID=UPI003A847E7D
MQTIHGRQDTIVAPSHCYSSKQKYQTVVENQRECTFCVVEGDGLSDGVCKQSVTRLLVATFCLPPPSDVCDATFCADSVWLLVATYCLPPPSDVCDATFYAHSVWLVVVTFCLPPPSDVCDATFYAHSVWLLVATFYLPPPSDVCDATFYAHSVWLPCSSIELYEDVWKMNMSREQWFQELQEGLQLVAPFGVYKVRRGIAIGRCCEVYEGEDCSTGEEVALKVFRRHQEYEGALQRELKFLNALSTPGAPVVKHIGEFQWQGRDVLVQELLSHTIRSVLIYHEDRTCSPWLIITLAAHILRGLKYLHDNGVVHADLKPPNIIWDTQTATFKLVDFGVSFTTTENFFHTVQSAGYQAPECVGWNRTKNVTGNTPALQRPGPPADIWSAGCILAEFLIGSQLFSGSSKCEDIPDTLRCALTSSSTHYTFKFLKDAYHFIIRCLQISPEERATAGDLLCDPWLVHQYRPSLFDLTLLPTCVLRILNVVDANRPTNLPETTDIEESILSLCQKYGRVCGYHLETSVGNFYIQYENASEAEIAQLVLNEMVFNDRTLIVTFYPRISWQHEEYF